MKKTLQEEKDRIITMMKNINEQNLYADDYGAKRDLEQLQRDEENQPLYTAIKNHINNLSARGWNREKIYQEIMDMVQAVLPEEEESDLTKINNQVMVDKQGLGVGFSRLD